MNKKTADQFQIQKCDCASGDCGQIERRDFLRFVALGAAASLTARMPVMAGPFEATDFEKLIPADKKLDPAWVKSLFARGEPTVYRAAELEKIGMPVGGICAGQLYLGGDGKLWHWDIFNQHIAHGRRALCQSADAELRRWSRVSRSALPRAERPQFRALDHTGFSDISFLRRVSDRRRSSTAIPALPVTVSLEAFSPFIPLNTDDSSPAGHDHAVHREEHRQREGRSRAVRLAGKCRRACTRAKSMPGRRQNRIVAQPSVLLAGMQSAEAADAKDAAPAAGHRLRGFPEGDLRGLGSDRRRRSARGRSSSRRFPHYQGDVGVEGAARGQLARLAPRATTSARRTAKTGTLTSKPFTIERNYINFWIGGGQHPGKTCINLLVDGKVGPRRPPGTTATRCGASRSTSRDLQGKTARLQIVDNESGPWGNIGVAEIVFSDKPAAPRRSSSRSSPISARWRWRCSIRRPAMSAAAAIANDRSPWPMAIPRRVAAEPTMPFGTEARRRAWAASCRSRRANRRRSRSSSPGTSPICG